MAQRSKQSASIEAITEGYLGEGMFEWVLKDGYEFNERKKEEMVGILARGKCS